VIDNDIRRFRNLFVLALIAMVLGSLVALCITTLPKVLP